MAVNYSTPTIDARLQAVADMIDAGGGNGNLILSAGGTTVSTIQLARPCGTVDGGILTFDGTLLDPAAAGTGVVDSARIEDFSGSVIVYGLSVGVPPSSGYNILITNGLGTTLITAGQSVAASGQITGS